MNAVLDGQHLQMASTYSRVTATQVESASVQGQANAAAGSDAASAVAASAAAAAATCCGSVQGMLDEAKAHAGMNSTLASRFFPLSQLPELVRMSATTSPSVTTSERAKLPAGIAGCFSSELLDRQCSACCIAGWAY